MKNNKHYDRIIEIVEWVPVKAHNYTMKQINSIIKYSNEKYGIKLKYDEINDEIREEK